MFGNEGFYGRPGMRLKLQTKRRRLGVFETTRNKQSDAGEAILLMMVRVEMADA